MAELIRDGSLIPDILEQICTVFEGGMDGSSLSLDSC